MKTSLIKTKKKNSRTGKNIFLACACFILTGICSFNCYAITNALKIKIAGNGSSDETVIRFITGATTAFDGSYDSWKVFSSSPSVPAIFSKSSANENLSINALPAFTESITKEVFLKISAAGNYDISAQEIGAFTADVKIIMKDLVTGSLYDLRSTDNYTIELPVIDQAASARFLVLFSYPAQARTTDVSCASCINGAASIIKAGQTNWNYVVTNSLGNTIESGASSTGTHVVNNLSRGNYTVLILSNFSVTDTLKFSINILLATGLGKGFTDFQAVLENKKVKIDWSTGVETNTDYFIVERSKNGTNYESIGTINAAGNSSLSRSYFFYDENPNTNGYSYYRIKLTDTDGTITYSKVVPVLLRDNISFSVYPIPASGSLNVYIENSKDLETTILIRDITGKNYFSEKIIPGSDQEHVSIDITNRLAAGMYIITLIEKEKVQEQKIIIN